MKKFLINGALILLVIGIAYLFYLKECGRNPCPPQNWILVKKSAWDSIMILSEKPPEIIIQHDTIKGKTVYVDRLVPIPVVVNSDTLTYTDSIKNDSMDVKSTIVVKGELLSWSWNYIPITFKEIITIKEYVPKIIETEVVLPKAGLYTSGLLGVHQNDFFYGVGVDYITQKDRVLGGFILYGAGTNYIGVKAGIRLKLPWR